MATQDTRRLFDRTLEADAYLVFDGGMGTLIQARGLDGLASSPVLLNLRAPEQIRDIHRAYVDAGAQVITTNTFGANALKLAGAATVEEVVRAGIACARDAGAPLVAQDIGPTGALLEPMGVLSFEDAYELFAEQVRVSQDCPCDLFIIETMSDLLEVKAAVLAVRENSDLPVFATMTFDEGGHTLMGTTPAIAALALDALGVDALGVNCSVGPDALCGVVEEMRAHTAKPIIAQPNAGMPHVADGITSYELDVDAFVAADTALVDAGATILGSCCGTTPAYTAALRRLANDATPRKRPSPTGTWITSAREAVNLAEVNTEDDAYLLNPERGDDPDDIVDAVFDAMDEEASLLVLDVDALDADDIPELVGSIQSSCPLPLAFKGGDANRLEAAMRPYAGVAGIMASEGAGESTIRPLALRYGCRLLANGRA